MSDQEPASSGYRAHYRGLPPAFALGPVTDNPFHVAPELRAVGLDLYRPERAVNGHTRKDTPWLR